MEMKKAWTWGGREYPFDISDADCIGRVCGAIRLLHEKTAGWETEQSPRENAPESPAEKLERLKNDASDYCDLVETFFSALFGAEISDALFGDNRSMYEHARIYADFMAFTGEQLNAMTESGNAARERYLAVAARLPV